MLCPPGACPPDNTTPILIGELGKSDCVDGSFDNST